MSEEEIEFIEYQKPIFDYGYTKQFYRSFLFDDLRYWKSHIGLHSSWHLNLEAVKRVKAIKKALRSEETK